MRRRMLCIRDRSNRRTTSAFLKEIAEESAMSHHIRAMHVEPITPLDRVTGFTIER